MLTLTDHAQDAVRALTPQAPESVWLRIAPGDQGFEFSLVTEPVPGDALIDDGKVQVFVEPQAAQMLDEQTLDAQLDEGGEVNFFLASPDAVPPPGGDDDGTAARHVASRAELLPEERAAGSDDPQAQARVILEESGVDEFAPGDRVEERTEQPEPGASSPSSREAPPED